MAVVNLLNDVVERSGKTYLEVKAVNAKLNIRSLITHLHSKSLSPIINGLINKAINTKWRSIHEDVQARLEEYMGKIMQSIISSLVDMTAPQDLFEQ